MATVKITRSSENPEEFQVSFEGLTLPELHAIENSLGERAHETGSRPARLLAELFDIAKASLNRKATS
jgi:hypothetical protein